MKLSFFPVFLGFSRNFRAVSTTLAISAALILGACSEEPAADTTPKGCDAGDPTKVADCVDLAAYETDLRYVAKPRPTGSAHHKDVQTTLVSRLKELGYEVTEQKYGVGTNIIGELKGTSKPDELVVIGGHYDGVPGCDAADDNATAVAGGLQAAAALARHKHERTIQIAFWDEEERGLVGSFHHANALSKAGRSVVAMFDFEMIGFVSDQPDSQNLPDGFEYIFTTAGEYLKKNSNTGDFIAAIYGINDKGAWAAYDAAAQKLGLPAVPVGLDGPKMEAPTLADLRRSDHAAFWSQGYPGIMLTDTANFRNTHYHCTAGKDTVDRLNHPFAIAVVKAAVNASVTLLKADGPAAKAPYKPACDLHKQDCPAGEKCTPFSHGARRIATCMKVVANPVGAYKSCTRPSGKIGDDNCEKGQYCTPWGLPYDGKTVSFQCVRPCYSDAGCGSDEVCVSLMWKAYGSAIAPLESGACVKKCDPFSDKCGANMMCSNSFLSSERLKDTFTCMRAGKIKLGEECKSYFWGECEAGLGCAFGAGGEDEKCRTLCDGSHACPSGQTCRISTYLDRADTGFCE